MNRSARLAHADAQLPAQVDAPLRFLVPGVAARRGSPVPLLQDEPHVDIFLQAAHPQLLAVRADERADGRQRAARGVGVDGRVVNPEHSSFRRHWDNQLQKPAAHGSPLSALISSHNGLLSKQI